MSGEQPQEIAQLDMLHTEIGGTNLLPLTTGDHIADADPCRCKKFPALINRRCRIVITQGKPINFRQNRPEKVVSRAIAEINIPRPQNPAGKAGRRQGANNQPGRPWRDKRWIGVGVEKQEITPLHTIPVHSETFAARD